jgi:hypothetical protein
MSTPTHPSNSVPRQLDIRPRNALALNGPKYSNGCGTWHSPYAQAIASGVSPRGYRREPMRLGTVHSVDR